MKIVSVKPVTTEIIEIEGRDWSTHERFPDGSWQVLMGNSWEPCYLDTAELEALYQAWKAAQ